MGVQLPSKKYNSNMSKKNYVFEWLGLFRWPSCIYQSETRILSPEFENHSKSGERLTIWNPDISEFWICLLQYKQILFEIFVAMSFLYCNFILKLITFSMFPSQFESRFEPGFYWRWTKGLTLILRLRLDQLRDSFSVPVQLAGSLKSQKQKGFGKELLKV